MRVCINLFYSSGGDPANVSKGHSEITTLGRLKFQSLCQLNNMSIPTTLSLDYKNQQCIFVCLCSSNELAILISNWDTQQKTDSTVTDMADLVTMDTTENVAIETSKKPKKRSSKKRSSSSAGVRRSVRLEAQRITSEIESLEKRSKEIEPKMPLEGAVRFMSNLKEMSKWNKLGKLPSVSAE